MREKQLEAKVIERLAEELAKADNKTPDATHRIEIAHARAGRRAGLGLDILL
jgi:hypothetical protein